MLFEYLVLRSSKDVRFLQDVLDKARTSRPCLIDSIQTILIDEAAGDVSQTTRSWLHHTHLLFAQLPKTSFHYRITGNVNDAAPIAGSLSMLPPPSSLRLTAIVLSRLHFANKTELARLIDGFPTLTSCQCKQLTFSDASPIIQSRRQRWFPPFLNWDAVWHCDGTVLTAQATLASDILMAHAHLALDGDDWSAVLQNLVALAPGSFDHVVMQLGSDNGLGMSFHCYKIHGNLPIVLH